MENRQENHERDEQMDDRINRLVAGNAGEGWGGTGADRVAQELARLTSEESPRMSNAARTEGLKELQAGAARKRAQRRPNPLALFFNFPRWAQIGAVAVVVVLIANGVSNAAADALPGSLLYPFKRFGEGGQLLIQNTNGQRAQLWMNLANTRLDEVQRLLASGARVDPPALDAIDESILRALSELAGTRGEERVELLKQLLALSIRQQQVVTQLAENASPADRARFEQTAKLLSGVASYAQSPDAASGPESNPFQFLTPSPAPSVTPTSSVMATPSATPTNTAIPGATPDVATAIPSPTNAPALPTQSTQPVPPQGNDNSNGNENANDNGDDKGGSNDNGDDDKGIANDNGGGDNQNDNGGSRSGDNQNDNGGADNQNDNGGSSGGDNQNDNGGGDNLNDNSGGDDHSGGDNQNDNGGGDNQNDNSGDDDHSGGDNQNDNGGGDNQNDNGAHENENDNGGN